MTEHLQQTGETAAPEKTQAKAEAKHATPKQKAEPKRPRAPRARKEKAPVQATAPAPDVIEESAPELGEATALQETAAQTMAEVPAEAPAPAAPQQSTWVFTAGGQNLTREDLLARYRRQRQLPDEPFENGAKPVPPPGYRDRIMAEQRPVPRFTERLEQVQKKPAPAPKRAPRTFTIGQTLAVAAAMALVAAGGAGTLSTYLSWNGASPTPQTATAAASMAAAPQLKTAGAAEAQTTIIAKKPVPTATLEVADVAGQTNSFIPLALHAEPAGLSSDMMLKISGIPENAYLTSGHKEDDQIWSLSLADLKDVKLVVPEAKQPEIDLAVAAFEPKTGELAAPVKTMTVALKDVVVQPTSAPPPQQVQSSAPSPQKAALPAAAAALPEPVPPPKNISMALATPVPPEAQKLLDEGDSLLKSGDVRAARKSYEQAWGKGSPAAAAYGVARTYDPVVLASLALKNAKPDKAKALDWYQRAASAGNADAAEAIVRLQLKS